MPAGDVTMTQTELVVAWDGRAASVAALSFAVGLARSLEAHIHVVHVADVDDLPIDPDSYDWEEELDTRLATLSESARSFLQPSGANWTYHSERGHPSSVISRIAERVDARMIVLGDQSGGMRSFIERITGLSVCRQLVGHHSRPLLLVSGRVTARELI